MIPMSLEELRRMLEMIPADEFRDTSQTWAIGHIYRIMTDERPFILNREGYPGDVIRVVSMWNTCLSPEDRKVLAMMLPLPEEFPDMTVNRAWKLAAWSIEIALNGYEGPGRALLESAAVLARRVAAGVPYTEDEAKAILADSNAMRKADPDRKWGPERSIHYLVDGLVTAALYRFMSDAVGTIVNAAVCFRDFGIEWRPWMEDYLRLRTEA